jgi:hypothetical protein
LKFRVVVLKDTLRAVSPVRTQTSTESTTSLRNVASWIIGSMAGGKAFSSSSNENAKALAAAMAWGRKSVDVSPVTGPIAKSQLHRYVGSVGGKPKRRFPNTCRPSMYNWQLLVDEDEPPGVSRTPENKASGLK